MALECKLLREIRIKTNFYGKGIFYGYSSYLFRYIMEFFKHTYTFIIFVQLHHLSFCALTSHTDQLSGLQVHIRVASPPLKHPCYMGINIPTRGELLANQKPIEELANHVGKDCVHILCHFHPLCLALYRMLNSSPSTCMDDTCTSLISLVI